MHYFIGNTFGFTITGIERAMMNRVQLFKKFNIPSKMVLLSWNPNTYDSAKRYHLENHLFTMYDFFQETRNVQTFTNKNWIEYWQQEMNYEIRYIEGMNDIRVYQNNQFIMYVNFHDKQRTKLGYINYFDNKRRKVKREIYDCRGFLSCTKVLYENKVIADYYYSPTGESKIEKYYKLEDDRTTLTNIILKNYKNNDYYFNSERELITFFYDALYEENDLFFSDKTVVTAEPFIYTKRDIPVYAVLHSTHTKNTENVDTASIKSIYQSVFSNLSRFKGIIVSTEEQKNDIARRISNQIPVYSIPVGYLNNEMIVKERHVPKSNRLLSLARYSKEKQLEHQIRLVDRLKNEIPDIELHMCGHGSELKQLQELVHDLKLDKHVFLKGFTNNIQEELSQANISLITSHTEGFSLALLESISNGVPTISYDIKYGPRELVSHDETGYLITLNDEEALYQNTRKLLLNHSIQQQFINNSLERAKLFSDEIVINKWQMLLTSH